MKEIWKDVNGYEGIYKVSSFGKVVSNTKWSKGKELKQGETWNGYLYVTLYKNKKPKCFRINRLVAEMFIPNPKQKPQVNHKDGVKHNNKVSNLEWCTIQENRDHACENGLQYRGLSNRDVVLIRKLLEEGSRTQEKIGKLFNANRVTISQIKRGIRYKNVTRIR